MPRIFCDIIRWILIVGATVFTVKWLWTIHWALGLFLALPVFVIFMNIFGFLTMPLYGFTTEARTALKGLKDLEEEVSNQNQRQEPDDC